MCEKTGDPTLIHVSKRRGKRRSSVLKDIDEFRDFISKSNLVDLPMPKRKFTWYRDDGSSCSRLDRFLVSNSWLEEWPSTIQIALK
ncbi:hypothetical protein ACS0TY_020966 [Phlomoides rotata]